MIRPAAFSDVTRSHPLELIPYFRRFPCSRARNLLYTFIWNVLLGTVFLVLNAAIAGRLPTAHQAWVYFVIVNFVGFAIHALLEAGGLLGIEAYARRHGFAAMTLYFTLLPTIGVIAGFQAADWIVDIGFRDWMVTPGWLVSVGATSLAISFILAVVFYLREREARGEALLERGRGQTERLQREAIAANLRALQAQVEPHFLFNTLANVSSLVDRDPREAKRMLERFIGFLRASLAATRTERTTLGAERELVAAYLDLLQVRMGSRLAYTIDIAPELESFALAPMLVQPIIENAIRHGLEPKMEGGSVELRARREGDAVVIEVRDSGVGFAAGANGGFGIANVRERLSGLYGERGRLEIAENRPAGTIVTLRIPA